MIVAERPPLALRLLLLWGLDDNQVEFLPSEYTSINDPLSVRMASPNAKGSAQRQV